MSNFIYNLYLPIHFSYIPSKFFECHNHINIPNHSWYEVFDHEFFILYSKLLNIIFQKLFLILFFYNKTWPNEQNSFEHIKSIQDQEVCLCFYFLFWRLYSLVTTSYMFDYCSQIFMTSCQYHLLSGHSFIIIDHAGLPRYSPHSLKKSINTTCSLLNYTYLINVSWQLIKYEIIKKTII